MNERMIKMKQIFTAASVEEAKLAACKEFGAEAEKSHLTLLKSQRRVFSES